MTYAFHPAAEAEYLESIGYYESKMTGLGAAFLAEFERSLARVCEAPERYPIERKPDIRRFPLTKFPFTVLYRHVSGSIQVLAVAHHQRRPQYWLGRL